MCCPFHCHLCAVTGKEKGRGLAPPAPGTHSKSPFLARDALSPACTLAGPGSAFFGRSSCCSLPTSTRYASLQGMQVAKGWLCFSLPVSGCGCGFGEQLSGVSSLLSLPRVFLVIHAKGNSLGWAQTHLQTVFQDNELLRGSP